MREEDRCAPPPEPRYKRFVRALVVGSAIATVPLAAGCGESRTPTDAGVTDAEVPTDRGFAVVDGPLPPPDLPRA